MAIYLDSLRQYFVRYFKKEKHEEERVSKFEAYVNVLYKVLIWEDTTLSSFAFIAMHMLFWYVDSFFNNYETMLNHVNFRVILQFELRLYGVFFLSLLIFFLLDASLENVITRSDKPVPLKNIREGVRVVNGIFHYLTTLRKEHPGTVGASKKYYSEKVKSDRPLNFVFIRSS